MIRPSRPDEGARIIEIWRGAVDATHHFLTPEDRLAIDEMVCGFLPHAPLWLAVDEHDDPLAFMLIDDGTWKRYSSIPPGAEPVLVLPSCSMASRFIQK